MPTLFHNPTKDLSERWLIEDANEEWYLFASEDGDYDPLDMVWGSNVAFEPLNGGTKIADLTVCEANALCARFHIDASEKTLEAYIRENHPAGFQTNKTITVETEPSADATITGDPNLLASLGLKAERIPRFGETCDEISATLAPHSREMRVLILETLLRIESGEVKP